MPCSLHQSLPFLPILIPCQRNLQQPARRKPFGSVEPASLVPWDTEQRRPRNREGRGGKPWVALSLERSPVTPVLRQLGATRPNSGLIVFTNVGEVARFPVRAFRPFCSLRLGFQLSKRLYKQTVTQFLDFRFPGNYYHFSPFLISSSPGVPDSYILLSEIPRPRSPWPIGQNTERRPKKRTCSSSGQVASVAS